MKAEGYSIAIQSAALLFVIWHTESIEISRCLLDFTERYPQGLWQNEIHLRRSADFRTVILALTPRGKSRRIISMRYAGDREKEKYSKHLD